MFSPGPPFHRAPRALTVLSIAAAALAGADCAKKGARTSPDAGTGDAPGDSGLDGLDGAIGPGPAPCPIAGTWQMTSIACGTLDQTASWFLAVPNTTLTVSALPTGGCRTVVTSQSASCREVVVETVVSTTTKPGWQVDSQGITECFPDACRFGVTDVDAGAGDASMAGPDAASVDGAPSDDASVDGAPTAPDAAPPATMGDAPCKLGDRAGTRVADSIVVWGDMFTATAPTPAGICRIYGLPQITIWQRRD